MANANVLMFSPAAAAARLRQHDRPRPTLPDRVAMGALIDDLQLLVLNRPIAFSVVATLARRFARAIRREGRA